MRTTADNQIGRTWYRTVARACGGLSVLFLAWVTFRFGGDRLTDVVDDIGELVAAWAATVCCGIAARAPGPRRTAWALLGASSFSWGAGEAAWCWYDLVRHVEVPFPGLADVGYLTAVPLAIGALLAFLTVVRTGRAPHDALTRLTLITTAIFFLALLAVIGAAPQDNSNSLVAQMIGLAYPVSDILMATGVLRVIRNESGDRRSLTLVLVGILAFALADSSFAFETASNNYGIGNSLDTGWVAGYFLMALGALWTVSHPDTTPDSTPEPAPTPRRAANSYQRPPLPRHGTTVMAGPAALALAPPSATWFTAQVADRIVSSAAILLILADTGISLYDLALMIGLIS